MSSIRTHFIYWILPTLVTLSCILLYFFNYFGASEIVSPKVNREFGILEHLQVLVLFVIFILAVRAVGIKENKLEKYLFIFASIISLFLLLEEIDYGFHYLELFHGNSRKVVDRNLHNTGKVTSVFKMTAYIVIVLFFVLLPFLPEKFTQRFPFLAYITPTKKIIGTTVSLLILNQLAFYFYRLNQHTNRSLDGNVSEFEELMIYYIIMLYVMEMSNRSKKLPSFYSA